MQQTTQHSFGALTTSTGQPLPLRLLDRTDLAGSGPPDRTVAVTHLVFHHTATATSTPPGRIVYRSPSGQVYPAPYHYLVYTDGLIVKTRPIRRRGVCVAGQNSRVVCVAGVGNWEDSDITTTEFVRACVQLAIALRVAMPSIVRIVRHSDMIHTRCPGKYFPFKTIVEEVKHALA